MTCADFCTLSYCHKQQETPPLVPQGAFSVTKYNILHWRNSYLLGNLHHNFSNPPFLHILVSFCISLMLHQSFINSDVNHAVLMHTLLHSLLLEKAEWLPYGQHVCLFCYDTNRKLNVRRHSL